MIINSYEFQISNFTVKLTKLKKLMMKMKKFQNRNIEYGPNSHEAIEIYHYYLVSNFNSEIIQTHVNLVKSEKLVASLGVLPESEAVLFNFVLTSLILRSLSNQLEEKAFVVFFSRSSVTTAMLVWMASCRTSIGRL